MVAYNILWTDHILPLPRKGTLPLLTKSLETKLSLEKSLETELSLEETLETIYPKLNLVSNQFIRNFWNYF
jgi:hypothetical protein